MDSIHPIAPGPPPISRSTRPPVEPIERVSRERDRPEQDTPQQKREQKRESEPGESAAKDGHPHIDVRV